MSVSCGTTSIAIVMDDDESELKATNHNDGTSSVGTGRDVGNMVDLVHPPEREHKVAFQDFLDVRETLHVHGLETHGSCRSV